MRSKIFSIYLVALLLFWIVISGSFHWQQLIAGLLVAYGVTRFNRKLLDELRGGLKSGCEGPLISIVPKLIKDIVIANIQVAKIVLSPRLPINPTVISFDTGLKSDVAKTLLANAITLTPGTLTIDIDRSTFVVHCLTEENAQDVANWGLIKHCKLLEENFK